jgi:hypothetical protein
MKLSKQKIIIISLIVLVIVVFLLRDKIQTIIGGTAIGDTGYYQPYQNV